MITVVCTTPQREMWLKDCLESIGDRPIMVLSDYSYEVCKLDFLVKHTKLERLLLLQDLDIGFLSMRILLSMFLQQY
jgi:hypothetical protein